MTRHDPAKLTAKHSIEATLNVEVKVNDTGDREGEYDLSYRDRGRRIAVEAKQITDQSLQQASAESSQAGYILDRRLTRTWIVYLSHEASWRHARAALPDLLLNLERIGWPGGAQRIWRMRPRHEPLYERFNALGVESVGSIEPTKQHPPGFYALPDGFGYAAPDLDRLPAFLSDWTASNDATKLRRQLTDAVDADERQAFLVLGFEHPYAVPLDAADEKLPNEPPTLAGPIDGVWVTTSSAGQESRLLAWLPHRGWIEGTRALDPPQT